MEAQSRLMEMAALLPAHVLILACILNAAAAAAASTAILLERGFSASPRTSSGEFQPLLADSNGLFAFGFLQPSPTQLDLAVVHLPSSFPVWRAFPARPTTWSESASLSFNGTLVFFDSHGSVLWSAAAAGGDTVVLLDTSNLQILMSSDVVVWQSFDFPADTLIQNQNFTANSLVLSTNQRYSLRLGSSFYGLYMDLGGGSAALPPPTLYYKHWALKYRSGGSPPLSLMVMPGGFLGLFQGTDNRVDLIPFDSFGRNLSAIHRLTLEADGNLRAYYWNDTHGWLTEYTTVTDDCGIPTACGGYGLCTEGVSAAARCHCLENSTDACPAAGGGDFCGGDPSSYSEFRREGVDLANKEWMRFEVVGSVDECEVACEENCTCWGSVYSNVSGYCYQINYPVQTLVAVDERKVGYFKVKNRGNGGGGGGRKKAEVAVLVVGLMILAGAAAFGAYRVWMWKKTGGGEGADRPYRELVKSVSLELSNPFRRKR